LSETTVNANPLATVKAIESSRQNVSQNVEVRFKGRPGLPYCCICFAEHHPRRVIFI